MAAVLPFFVIHYKTFAIPEMLTSMEADKCRISENKFVNRFSSHS